MHYLSLTEFHCPKLFMINFHRTFNSNKKNKSVSSGCENNIKLFVFFFFLYNIFNLSKFKVMSEKKL